MLGGWEEERKGFYEERGWTVEEVERRRDGGELTGEELVRVERRLQERFRWERIRQSRFNRWYGAVKGVGESRWRRVARFRLGSEMRGGGYIGRMRIKGDVVYAGGGRKLGNMFARNVQVGEREGVGRSWWGKCWEMMERGKSG